MGLDMYAYSIKEDRVLSDFDFLESHNEGTEEFFYWRKNQHLHTWMEYLWEYKKFGNSDGSHFKEFNCKLVRVTLEDLDRLESCIKKNNLPTHDKDNYFLGQRDYDSSKRDLEFINRSRRLIKDGYAIYYDSWW